MFYQSSFCQYKSALYPLCEFRNLSRPLTNGPISVRTNGCASPVAPHRPPCPLNRPKHCQTDEQHDAITGSCSRIRHLYFCTSIHTQWGIQVWVCKHAPWSRCFKTNFLATAAEHLPQERDKKWLPKCQPYLSLNANRGTNLSVYILFTLICSYTSIYYQGQKSFPLLFFFYQYSAAYYLNLFWSINLLSSLSPFYFPI